MEDPALILEDSSGIVNFSFGPEESFDATFTGDEVLDSLFSDDETFDAELEDDDAGLVFSFDDRESYIHLPIATRELLGGVIIGDRLSITEEGLLSADEQIPEDDYTLITNLDINQILNS